MSVGARHGVLSSFHASIPADAKLVRLELRRQGRPVVIANAVLKGDVEHGGGGVKARVRDVKHVIHDRKQVLQLGRQRGALPRRQRVDGRNLAACIPGVEYGVVLLKDGRDQLGHTLVLVGPGHDDGVRHGHGDAVHNGKTGVMLVRVGARVRWVHGAVHELVQRGLGRSDEADGVLLVEQAVVRDGIGAAVGQAGGELGLVRRGRGRGRGRLALAFRGLLRCGRNAAHGVHGAPRRSQRAGGMAARARGIGLKTAAARARDGRRARLRATASTNAARSAARRSAAQRGAARAP
ncbi:hypothetical protein FGB62_120g127 [Gracilaria domingensis]|nr:hypothetical protein FGB62_120g127 [Gracilaria domingensis]